jgi:alcohol dehydrogenase class IV
MLATHGLAMNAVRLARVPEIIQGAGALEALGATLAAYVPPGSALLLVADPGLRASGLIESAAAALRGGGYSALLCDDVQSDPTMAQADAAAAMARRERVAGVVAIGGGSAMDVGKTTAAVALADRPASYYGLCAQPFPAKRLVSVCLPTTSGTGSEATRTAVLAAQDHSKVWLWGDELKPSLIVLDPALTTGLPASLTAATGIDALVHAIEASTNANAHAANDVFCHEAIRLVARHLIRAVEAPADLQARAGMQRAATLAGIGIDNCGTAIAHNIGHALASLRPPRLRWARRAKRRACQPRLSGCCAAAASRSRSPGRAMIIFAQRNWRCRWRDPRMRRCAARTAARSPMPTCWPLPRPS